jgi:hypothetical protein
MSKRTITLTNRPPVSINEDNWPLIASAKDSDHDNQYECQANQKWKWFVGVRQHKDGRVIVYATYTHTSQWAGSNDTYDRQGDYLDYKAAPMEHIITSIINVCARMEGERWDTLKDDCIADLPAEDIDGDDDALAQAKAAHDASPQGQIELADIKAEIERLPRL